MEQQLISIGYHASIKGGFVIYLHDSGKFKIVPSKVNSQIWGVYTDMVYVVGDFNINLLAINDIQFNSDYFDSVLAAGYLPTVTLPTRLAQHSTLIDNIFTNNLKDFTAVVLEDYISDHLATIVSADTELPRRPEKYVIVRSNDEQSKIKFDETVAHMTVASLLDLRADAEPNNSYAILENCDG